MNTILAKKIRMGQDFIGNVRVPTTKVTAGPCVVTMVKDHKKDGYFSVQIGYGDKKIKNITKPLLGHLKGAIKEKRAPSFLREVKIEETDYKIGDLVAVSDVLSQGDTVTVTATSKGKGFAGGMKRWGFAGGPRTHGQSDRQRSPGSIGQGTTPGRVRKGKKMAGRMGGKTAVTKNLKVLSVDPQTNQVVLSGPVPGPKGGYLLIERTNQRNKKEDSEE